MAHPWYHAVLAARRYGGTPEDYLEVETWMDFTKSHIARLPPPPAAAQRLGRLPRRAHPGRDDDPRL